MTKNNKLADQTNEQLIQNEKKVKVITLLFLGGLFLLFLITIYLTYRNGFTPLSILPITLMPVLIASIGNWNALKKEIKSRNL